MRFILSLVGVVFALSLSSVVYAQGQVENADDILQKKEDVSVAPASNGAAFSYTASLKKAAEENGNQDILAKKNALAKRMHEIRPTREQIDAAVQRASMMLPENERGPFVNVMSGMLNYNAIERISMDAMVETYTLKELEIMVEFYSQPEALSASMKMGVWAQKVQPEIVRMIDKAILRIKTGE